MYSTHILPLQLQKIVIKANHIYSTLYINTYGRQTSTLTKCAKQLLFEAWEDMLINGNGASPPRRIDLHGQHARTIIS